MKMHIKVRVHYHSKSADEKDSLYQVVKSALLEKGVGTCGGLGSTGFPGWVDFFVDLKDKLDDIETGLKTVDEVARNHGPEYKLEIFLADEKRRLMIHPFNYVGLAGC